MNPDLPTAPADVLILPMTEDLAAIALATQLRENGIRTQLHCEEKKFKQKISYADKVAGIPYVIFLGEDDIRGRRGGLQGHGHRRTDQAGTRRHDIPHQSRLGRTGTGTVILEK